MGPESSSSTYVPFPAVSKQVKSIINNIKTEASSTFFADKILITISQSERLSQWVEVPLDSSNAASIEELSQIDLPSDNGHEIILPANHLMPKTLLGAGGEQRENTGHLIALHIADSIIKKNPDETRTILVGLGLEKVVLQREDFFDIMELLRQVT